MYVHNKVYYDQEPEVGIKKGKVSCHQYLHSRTEAQGPLSYHHEFNMLHCKQSIPVYTKNKKILELAD